MNALLKKSIAEFIGVTVFLTAITASMNDYKTFAISLTMATMIIILRPISGAHLNPIVSLYFYLKREITLGNLLAFTAAQFAGSLAGSQLGALISGKTIAGFAGNSDNLPISYLAGEVLVSAGMVWLIASLINNKQTTWIPFAVAGWILAATNFTLTGGQANPAVTFGVMFQGMAANQGVSLIVAQLSGLVLALILLMVFAPAKAKRPAAKRK
jgi:glycerol uptake facilitator-like aquaporin